jgi:diaminopimelate epimerase
MKKILEFTKMVASGNDFIVIAGHRTPDTGHLPNLAKKMCDRKYGIGADGVLVLDKVKKADLRMRIFNADGSEAEMCGNGARCAALYFSCHLVRGHSPQQKIIIQTKAGIIESLVNKDTVRIKLTEPKSLKFDIPIKVNGRGLKVNFINTGVPHTVIFVDGLDKIGVFNLGRLIRNHKQFSPAGTNVNFVEVLNNNSIRIRTYERGVEDETLACGTGSTAAALIAAYHLPLITGGLINVHTKGGEILKVYYKKVGDNFKDVWLEGKASIVYKGVYYV